MPHIDPWWLALLIVVPALIWFKTRGRPEPAIAFPAVSMLRMLPRTRRARWGTLPFWIRVGCLVVLAIAMTRPRLGTRQVRHTGRGAAIEILIDRSTSMDSDYGSTTEFNAARQLAAEFVQSRGSDLVGLLAFANRARTIAPLTFDHDALIRSIRRIDLASEDEDGTNIGAALMVAAARLQAAGLGRASRAIVLFTDAQSSWDDHLSEAAALITDWRIRVHVIHIDDGVPPNFGRRYAHEHGYDTETRLRRLAALSGGTYAITRDPDAMKRACAAIDAVEPQELPSMQLAGGSEFFPALLIAALALLLFEVCASSLWLRSIP